MCIRDSNLAVFEEQNRISRELHDTMAQQIVAIQRQVEYLQCSLGVEGRPQVKEEFDLTYKMIHELYEETRELISGLRTFEVGRSFESSLNVYLDYYQNNNPIHVAACVEPGIQLASNEQLQLLRIIPVSYTHLVFFRDNCRVLMQAYPLYGDKIRRMSQEMGRSAVEKHILHEGVLERTWNYWLERARKVMPDL